MECTFYIFVSEFSAFIKGEWVHYYGQLQIDDRQVLKIRSLIDEIDIEDKFDHTPFIKRKISDKEKV